MKAMLEGAGETSKQLFVWGASDIPALESNIKENVTSGKEIKAGYYRFWPDEKVVFACRLLHAEDEKALTHLPPLEKGRAPTSESGGPSEESLPCTCTTM
jgi:hypothetical protein